MMSNALLNGRPTEGRVVIEIYPDVAQRLGGLIQGLVIGSGRPLPEVDADLADLVDHLAYGPTYVGGDDE